MESLAATEYAITFRIISEEIGTVSVIWWYTYHKGNITKRIIQKQNFRKKANKAETNEAGTWNTE